MNLSKTPLIIIVLLTCLLSVAANGQSAKSDSYFAKGVEAYSKGKYREAIKHFEKSHKIDYQELPSSSVRREYSLDWLARCYYLAGDTALAREKSPLRYTLEPVDRRLTTESDLEGQMASDCAAENDIEGAINHSLKCLSIEERVLGPDSYFAAGSALNLATYYALSGNFDNALDYCAKALKKLDRGIGRFNAIAFNTLQLRADINIANGFSASTEADINEMRTIAEHIENQDSNSFPTGVTAFYASNAHVRNKEHIDAVAESKIAVKKFLASYKADDNDSFEFLRLATSLLNSLGQQDIVAASLTEFLNSHQCSKIHAGILYHELGGCTIDSKLSREYLEKSAAMLKGHPDYIDSYNEVLCDLAYADVTAGVADKAIASLNSVCDHYKSTDPDNTVYTYAMHSLADIYESQGQYAKALECYDTLNSYRNLSHDDPDYILTQLKRAPVYLKLKNGQIDFNESYAFGQEIGKCLAAFDINKSLNSGIGHQQILNVFIPFLIVGTQVQGFNWAYMESIVSDLLYKYLIPVYTEQHPTSCETMTLLAAINYLRGKNADAVNLQLQAIKGFEKLGFETDGYYMDLAQYQFQAGDRTAACQSFAKFFEFTKKQVMENYRWMTLTERTEYTNSFRGNIDNLPHYAVLQPDNAEYAKLGYNALLFSKGLLLNSTIELTRLLQEAGDSETIAILDNWREACKNLQNSDNSNAALHNRYRAHADSLERNLIARSRIFGDYTAGLAVDCDDVREALGDGDIAVELFSWVADARSREYGALILARDLEPVYVSIGKDSEWRDLIDDGYGKPELFDALFANLKPLMPTRDHGTVYFAPEGIIHTIAVENLEGAENYDLRRLTSTRELTLRNRTKAPDSKDITIYGGIQYRLGDLAEIDIDNSDVLADYLNDLPGTMDEARNIGTVLKDKMNVDLHLRESATEEAFKNLSGKRVSMVHLATHGFFRNHIEGENATELYEEAMKSSGLYFAGAQNTIWNEPCESMTEDGILTAQEISTLDFRGMKMAVLSACETARGAMSPEGVFGLQRGFKQAGAQSLLLSLWKVDDAATKLLMENFYNHLAQGRSQNDALRLAREETRRIYPDPRSWAAFILIDAKEKI